MGSDSIDEPGAEPAKQTSRHAASDRQGRHAVRTPGEAGKDAGASASLISSSLTSPFCPSVCSCFFLSHVGRHPVPIHCLDSDVAPGRNGRRPPPRELREERLDASEAALDRLLLRPEAPEWDSASVSVPHPPSELESSSVRQSDLPLDREEFELLRLRPHRRPLPSKLPSVPCASPCTSGTSGASWLRAASRLPSEVVPARPLWVVRLGRRRPPLSDRGEVVSERGLGVSGFHEVWPDPLAASGPPTVTCLRLGAPSSTLSLGSLSRPTPLMTPAPFDLGSFVRGP